MFKSLAVAGVGAIVCPNNLFHTQFLRKANVLKREGLVKPLYGLSFSELLPEDLIEIVSDTSDYAHLKQFKVLATANRDVVVANRDGNHALVLEVI